MDLIGVLTVIALILWIVLCLALLGGLAYAAPTLHRLSRLLELLEDTIRRTERELDPTLDRLRRAVDHAEYITAAVRSDVESVGDTVDQAARSTRRLLQMAEERAVEINGFLEVVQEEAEETFLSTASLLSALRGRGRGSDERGRKRA